MLTKDERNRVLLRVFVLLIISLGLYFGLNKWFLKKTESFQSQIRQEEEYMKALEDIEGEIPIYREALFEMEKQVENVSKYVTAETNQEDAIKIWNGYFTLVDVIPDSYGFSSGTFDNYLLEEIIANKEEAEKEKEAEKALQEESVNEETDGSSDELDDTTPLESDPSDSTEEKVDIYEKEIVNNIMLQVIDYQKHNLDFVCSFKDVMRFLEIIQKDNQTFVSKEIDLSISEENAALSIMNEGDEEKEIVSLLNHDEVQVKLSLDLISENAERRDSYLNSIISATSTESE